MPNIPSILLVAFSLLPLTACDKPTETPPPPATKKPAAPAPTPTPPSTTPPRSPALSREPLDARVQRAGSVSPPHPATPTDNSAAGQSLTRTLPTSDEVSVFKDNQWLPARIRQRNGQRALVEFDGRSSSENQWVSADRVRPR